MTDQAGSGEVYSADLEAPLHLRDAARREIDIRIVPFNVVAETRDGPEVWLPGSTEGVDPSKVVLRMDHVDPPAGRGMSIEERDDGAYMTFRVSKTARGDEIIALVEDGVVGGASVGYLKGSPSVIEHMTYRGRRVRVVHKGGIRETSVTWQPTWDAAAVLAIRSEDLSDIPEETDTVTDTTSTAPVADPAPAPAPAVDITPLQSMLERSLADFGQRIDTIDESLRRQVHVPAPAEEIAPRAKRGEWMSAVLQMLSGSRPSELAMRDIADLVTTDNVGVVPDAFSPEIIGIIDTSRPFLGSTRRLDLPNAGMSLVVPKIVTRPTTGVQAEEKDDLTSTATSITTESFDAITIGGVGDISLQLLKRSSPSFLSLYLELLAESLSRNAEIKALQSVLTGATSGGAMDPEDLELGDAWTNGANLNITPDTIWLSTEAVGAFIDAKADGTNAPLYSQIQSGFTAGSGPAGTISGLRPVHVPALDAASSTVDVIVGPSRGFGWTEDGTYTLQVDVPAKAGRDVALVSLLWFAPMYPAAFTKYTIAS